MNYIDKGDKCSTLCSSIWSLRFVQLETLPPNIGYININKNQTDQSAIPKSYKVRVMERLPPETLLVRHRAVGICNEGPCHDV